MKFVNMQAAWGALMSAFGQGSGSPALDVWGRPQAAGLEHLIDAKARGARVRVLPPTTAKKRGKARPAGSKMARKVAEHRERTGKNYAAFYEHGKTVERSQAMKADIRARQRAHRRIRAAAAAAHVYGAPGLAQVLQ